MTLILLTAMGQAVASSMLFCQMDMSGSEHPMSVAQTPMEQMAGMDHHAGMDMAHMERPMQHVSSMDMDMDMDMTEGCGGDCSCTLGCSSAAIPDLMPGQNLFISTTLKINFYSAQALSQRPSSLYRPPIFS